MDVPAGQSTSTSAPPLHPTLREAVRSPRRRRPTGAAPPLPYRLQTSGVGWLVAALVLVGLTLAIFGRGLRGPAVAVTVVDDAVVGWLAVARTGVRDPDAHEAGFNPLTVASTQDDHKAYYPGAHKLHIRITGDQTSGRLLGAQLVGDHRAEVAKRIDIPAGALFHHMTVDGLNDLDLSYTPPFGSPWDAIQLAAQAWTRQAGRSLAAASPAPGVGP